MAIKIFSDGADIADIRKANDDAAISGMTTNPTLMSKAGVTDYLSFCNNVLNFVTEKPFSVEVFSDELSEMERQARVLCELGHNVYVKIPIVNSIGVSTIPLIKELSRSGIKLNVTAIFTCQQIVDTCTALDPAVPSYISIFAGRIADAGVDPEGYVRFCAEIKNKNHEIIWASPREAFNIIQAERSGAEIITATPELISKSDGFGRDLFEFSVATSKMFYDDALKSKFNIR